MKKRRKKIILCEHCGAVIKKPRKKYRKMTRKELLARSKKRIAAERAKLKNDPEVQRRMRAMQEIVKQNLK
jgi:hypothetical protein